VATENLYATSRLSGTALTNDSNALGSTSATWAGDVNTNTSWTNRYAMGDPTGTTANGTHTVTVRARKGSNTSDPTIALNLYENGSLVGAIVGNTNVTSTTGQDVSGTFSAASISNVNNVEIEVVMTAAGGSPSARNSAQIDYIHWSGDFTATANGTFDTLAGVGTATGGSSSFTGTAVFDTVAGSATAAGGVTSFSARSGPTVKSSATNNSGTGANVNWTVTLPSGISDGDVGYILMTLNTSNDRGDISGWTLLDFTTQGTVLQTKVYRKVLAASDSSTAVSLTLSNAQKWNAVAVVVQNEGGVDVEGTPFTSATDSTSWQLDSITPTVDDTLLLGFHGWRVNVTGTTTQSPPTAWTEIAETSQNASATPVNGAGVNYQEITGGASSATTQQTDGGYDQTTNQRITYVIAIAPSGSPDATFTTVAGVGTASGGSTSFTGNATFDTVAGVGTTGGGSTTFTGTATFDTVAGVGTATGGSTTMSGTATFDTLAGSATAAGGVTTFDTSASATFTTLAGEGVASGGSTSFTGTATFDTLAGVGTAAGGSTTFNAGATFDTVAGVGTTGGGSTTFTGSATFDTLAGSATAGGGDTSFVGDAALYFTEDYEGTPGATMSSSNTNWEIFNPGGSGNWTLESSPTPMFGSTLGEYNGGQAITKDTTSLPGTTNGGSVQRILYFRGYFSVDSVTNLTLSRMIVFEQSVANGGADVGVLRMNANGTFRLMDGTTAVGSASTQAISTTPTRIELKLDQDNNQITYRLWWGSDVHNASTGATNYETQTATLATNTDMEVFGVGFYASQTTNHSLYVEEVAVGSGDWIGPASQAATFTTLAGSGTATGGSTSFTGNATFDTLAGSATAAGGVTTFDTSSDATFTTLAGDAPAAGGVSSFTGGATFTTLAGSATAAGGVTTFDTSSDGTFTTLAGSAPASGGVTTFTGTATFTTLAGSATGAGGSTSITGGATFTTTAGVGTTGGGSTSMSGTAVFTTLAGQATAAGGVTTFSVEGDGTFSTLAGVGTAAGGVTSMSGTATFTTLAGAGTAGGGVTSFAGGATFTTLAGAATAAGGVTTFDATGSATFVTLAGAAVAAGGVSTFDGTTPDATFVTLVGTATAGGGVTTFDVQAAAWVFTVPASNTANGYPYGRSPAGRLFPRVSGSPIHYCVMIFDLDTTPRVVKTLRPNTAQMSAADRVYLGPGEYRVEEAEYDALATLFPDALVPVGG